MEKLVARIEDPIADDEFLELAPEPGPYTSEQVLAIVRDFGACTAEQIIDELPERFPGEDASLWEMQRAIQIALEYHKIGLDLSLNIVPAKPRAPTLIAISS
jgi:hypothetical protein